MPSKELEAIRFTRDITPYAVIQEVNRVLKEAGEKPLPVQMGYNYAQTRWGRHVYKKEDRILVKRTFASTWANTYLQNRLGKVPQAG
jgi:hypothetical protein